MQLWSWGSRAPSTEVFQQRKGFQPRPANVGSCQTGFCDPSKQAAPAPDLLTLPLPHQKRKLDCRLFI